MKMGVVADDVTGSNDIGIMFAKSDYLTHVYSFEASSSFAVSKAELRAPDILILVTNSRLDPPPVAYDKVFAATRELQQAGCRQFHNKTCSVFRGNIGAEFDAMLDALGLEFAVVVLGFPKNGRTTVDGIHYVHGKKLEDSEFRRDPIHPMRRSDLVGILQVEGHRHHGAVRLDAVVEARPGLAEVAAAVKRAVRAAGGRAEAGVQCARLLGRDPHVAAVGERREPADLHVAPRRATS